MQGGVSGVPTIRPAVVTSGVEILTFFAEARTGMGGEDIISGVPVTCDER
jgi:hypothetical protein